MQTYYPPVSQLLTLGKGSLREEHWLDYVGPYRIGPENVSDLLSMVADRDLAKSEPPEAYAPIHAWRALGQLRAEAAVPVLIQELLASTGDDWWDWLTEGVPVVIGMIGPSAISKLAEALADVSQSDDGRRNLVRGFVEIAKRFPESADECIAIITRQLEQAEQQEEVFNAELVSSLLDLDAKGSADVIERAYKANRVDEGYVGDWPAVRDELELGPKPPSRFNNHLPEMLQAGWRADAGTAHVGKSPKAKAKARRKMAKASRKRNRSNR